LNGVLLHRLRLLSHLATIKALIWLSMLGRDSELLPQTHDGLALIYLRLEDAECLAGDEWKSAQYRNLAARHAGDLADLYFELAHEAREANDAGAADRFRRRGELHLGPRPAAAMAMPIPQPRRFIDARGKFIDPA
jgi:hypothetical protein